VQQNITMRKIRKHIFCRWSGNSIKRKTTPGQPNPGFPLFRRQSQLQSSSTHIPYAVAVPWTLTCNPTRTLPNQVTYLKGSSMKSFTLGPTPKIDFTRTVEHTPATARELADLQFSLNTLSKHYGIRYRIHTNYKPRAFYLKAYRNPKFSQIRTLAIERPDES
jgi:hypothetical protein